MERKYQVFISSTYDDLRKEREKVRDAILSMYHFPVGMELFGAASEEQWKIIKETIDTSDYYVLIIGQRYGSVIPEGPDKGISYTEKEFRYAIKKNIPVLVFIMDENTLVKPEYVEKKHIEEFERFINIVKKGRLVTWWNNPDDLAQKVTTALYKQIERTPRPGWTRNESIILENKADIDNQKKPSAFNELLSNTYDHMVEYRRAFRNGDQEKINISTNELNDALQRVFEYGERNKFSEKHNSEVAFEITKQYNSYAVLFRQFAAFPPDQRMSDAAQQVAESAQISFNNLMEYIAKSLAEK